MERLVITIFEELALQPQIENFRTNKHTLKKMEETVAMLKRLCGGLPLDPLPESQSPTPGIAHASRRPIKLNQNEKRVYQIHVKT